MAGRDYDDFRLHFTRLVAAVIEGLCHDVQPLGIGAHGHGGRGGSAEFVSVSALTRLTGLKIVAVPEGRPKRPPDLSPLPGLEAAVNRRG